MGTAAARTALDGANIKRVVQVDLSGIAWERTPSQGTAITATPSASGYALTTQTFATLSGLFPAVAGQTNYISGFQMTATAASSASPQQASVLITGAVGTTQNYVYWVKPAPNSYGEPLNVSFVPALAASSPSQNLSIVAGSFPSAAGGAVLAAQGFRL